MGIQISKAQPEALKQVPSSSTDVEETSISTSQNPEVKDFSGAMAGGQSCSQDLLVGQQASQEQSSLSSMGRHNSFEATEMKKNNENAVQETAPSSAEQSADSCSELLERHADVLPPTNSRCSDRDIVSEVHDYRVRDLLDQVMEYNKDHPGLIRNIRLRERTFGVLKPDNGVKALEAFEQKHSSSQVQVLRNFCDGNVTAIVAKESTIEFNIKESEP